MLKLFSKFASDILPSVVATIIGAYIVNHYIVTKPGADAPITASTSDSKKTAEPSSDVTNIPNAGVTAKGISEKAVFEKSPLDKPVAEKAATEKPSAEKPAETASLPVSEPVERHHTPAPQPARDKTAIRVIPMTTQPAAAPVSAPAVPTPPVEAAVAPEEHKDANDLARAAIERLRNSTDSAPRTQEAARAPEPARIPETARASVPVAPAPVAVSVPVVSPSPMRPLPPPINVAAPSVESLPPQAKPSYSASARMDDPRRPIPPADIPGASAPGTSGYGASASSGPLDLRAEASPPPARERDRLSVGAVGEDMLSAAKSVFHAVVPQQ